MNVLQNLPEGMTPRQLLHQGIARQLEGRLDAGLPSQVIALAQFQSFAILFRLHGFEGISMLFATQTLWHLALYAT